MVRYAQLHDVEKIMEFIDNNWKKGHILGNDYEFFLYEHTNDNECNFVISENDVGKIEAILGFIPYGKKNRDITTMMWMAVKTSAPLVGLSLLNFLSRDNNNRSLSATGVNARTIPLYHSLGFVTGKMRHWYRINPNIEYKIAGIVDYKIPQYNSKQLKVIRIRSEEELLNAIDFEEYRDRNTIPYKEEWYVIKRYFNHPIYTYEAYGIMEGEKAKAVVFLRIQKMDDSFCIRLVDCIGDYTAIAGATEFFDALLIEKKAEYIDCYVGGLADINFEEGGWVDIEQSQNIIPNYFDPYMKENIDIYYYSSSAKTVLFKADGDQDRPNSKRMAFKKGINS